eukprot:Lithocolla_globosa_v1_NODE_659_length_3496_cov_10.987504.p1 type:complete len:797 gc:universal NODE_659_length_3496_cov_10.987504:2420-30(-)
MSLVCLVALFGVALGTGALPLLRRSDKVGEFEVLESSLDYLSSLKQPVYVVSAVGAFHSGKSFLLNQLSQNNKFEVGSNTEPTTQGIWMLPAETINQGEENEVKLLFLDTEGFFAHNTDDDYDAKIFSITSILSNHLLYSTLGGLNSDEIDQIKLLARRARLFETKSIIPEQTETNEKAQVSPLYDIFHPMSEISIVPEKNGISRQDKTGDLQETHYFSGEETEDLLNFPKLTIVVQSFFQALVNGENPTEWMHRFLAKDDRKEDGTLLNMFDSIDCHVLFLPSTEPSVLKSLDKATIKDLHPDYLDDVTALRDKVLERINSGQELMTGTQLAQYLRLLVSTANQGKMSKLPNMWQLYLESQVNEAIQEALNFLRFTMTTVVSQSNPVCSAVMDSAMEDASKQAKSLFTKLVFGLKAEKQWSTQTQTQLLMDKFLNQWQKIVSDTTEQFLQRIERDFKEFLSELEKSYPIPTEQLYQKADQALSEVTQDVQQHVLCYPKENTQVSRFEKNLENLVDKSAKKNEEEQKKILDKGITAAGILYQNEAKNVRCVSEQNLNEHHKKISEKAKQEYLKVSSAGQSAEKKVIENYQRILIGEMEARKQDMSTMNEKCVDTKCQEISNDLLMKVRSNTNTITLPTEPKQIEKQIEKTIASVLTDYREKVETKYAGIGAVARGRSELLKEIEKIKTDLENKNINLWTQLVEEPLKEATSFLQSFGWGYFYLTYWNQVYDTAKTQLGRQDSYQIPKEMTDQVIRKWMEKEPISSLLSKSRAVTVGATLALASVLMLAIWKLRTGL